MLRKIITIIFISLLLVSKSLYAEALPILSGVGGNFNAIGSKGKEFEFDSLKGNVVLLAFGYSNCADICPFTLGYLNKVYSGLSIEEQEQVRVVFVTVDPEYDTPEHLEEFLEYFNKDFIGISGTREQIDEIVALYQANYQAISTEDGVETKLIRRINEKEVQSGGKDLATLFSHTLSIYLVDQQGNTRGIEYTGTVTEDFVSKIQQLLSEGNNSAKINKSEIAVENFRVSLPPGVARSTAGYGTIKNPGSESDTLFGIRNNIASNVMLHETKMVSGYREIEVEVPVLRAQGI